MAGLRDRLLRMIGPTPLVRSLAGQSVISAFGEGAFLTGSAVFFTIIVGLSAQQVGLGLSIAALTRFALSVPLGRLADRMGPKQCGSSPARSRPSCTPRGRC